MKSRTLVILIVLAVAAVALTALLERDQAGMDDDLVGRALLPGLEAQLNDITMLKVVASGDDGTTTIAREDAGWVVAEKSGYRADAGVIRQLLIRLAEARVVELKTANPDYFERLGVGDVGTEHGGVQVSLQGPDEPVSLIVGEQEVRGGNGTYVRLAGSNQTYLIDAQLAPPVTPVGWLDTGLIDIGAEEIDSIAIRQDDGLVLEIERDESGLVVLDLPDGRTLESANAPRSMAGVFKALSLEDVMPAEDFGDEPPAAVAEYGLADGRRLTVRLWQRDDGRHAAFRMTYAAPQEAASGDTPQEATTEGDPADDETTTDEAPADQTAAAVDPADEAAALDQRLKDWVYRIPAHKYDLMARRADDLLAAPSLE